MANKFMIKDNHIIVNPNTKKENDLTEEGSECSICTYSQCNFCGHYNKEIPSYGEQKFCDWFTIVEDYEEIEEV